MYRKDAYLTFEMKCWHFCSFWLLDAYWTSSRKLLTM